VVIASRRDQALLLRGALVFLYWSDIATGLFTREGSRPLNPRDLRSVGQEMASVGADMVGRANELDQVIDNADAG
jgi:hypothetical protein